MWEQGHTGNNLCQAKKVRGGSRKGKASHTGLGVMQAHKVPCGLNAGCEHACVLRADTGHLEEKGREQEVKLEKVG